MITALDKNTALVLIDLQKGIVKNPALKSADGLFKNVNKLIDAFRKQDLPVVVVNVNPANAKWQHARKEAKQQQPPADPAAVEIAEEVNTQPGDIFITKHTWGAFFETKLHEELQKRNVTGIVLGGVSTSIGVEGTARQAQERGYNVSFAQDAMADSAPESEERSLKYIFPRIGETGDTNSIIEKLQDRE